MASGGATVSLTPDDKNTFDAEFKRDTNIDDREVIPAKEATVAVLANMS